MALASHDGVTADWIPVLVLALLRVDHVSGQQ